jgi:hypothetical protein
MSNMSLQKSLNMWRNATLYNTTFTGTITLPAGSALKNQELTGFVSSIVSATAIVATIPVKITGTLTSLSVACNVATVTGPASFTFYRVESDGTTTAIASGIVSVATTVIANVSVTASVSQAFVAGDSLKVIVGGTNTGAGNAHFAGLFTVA